MLQHRGYGRCLWLTMSSISQKWIHKVGHRINTQPHVPHITVDTHVLNEEKNPLPMDLAPIIFDPRTLKSTTDYPWGLSHPFHAITLDVLNPPIYLPKDAHLSLAYRIGGKPFSATDLDHCCAILPSDAVDTPKYARYVNCEDPEFSVWGVQFQQQ